MGVPDKPTADPTEVAADIPDPVDEGDLVRARRMMIESPPRYAEAIEIYSAVLTKAPSGSAIATAAKKGLERAELQMGLDEFQRELEQELIVARTARTLRHLRLLAVRELALQVSLQESGR